MEREKTEKTTHKERDKSSQKSPGEQSRKEKTVSKSDESPLAGRTMADYLDIEADRESYRLEKFGKLLAGPNTDLEALRRLGWAGIPTAVRATTWQLLLVRQIH